VVGNPDLKQSLQIVLISQTIVIVFWLKPFLPKYIFRTTSNLISSIEILTQKVQNSNHSNKYKWKFFS
jgi:hypothetical protein